MSGVDFHSSPSESRAWTPKTVSQRICSAGSLHTGLQTPVYHQYTDHDDSESLSNSEDPLNRGNTKNVLSPHKVAWYRNSKVSNLWSKGPGFNSWLSCCKVVTAWIVDGMWTSNHKNKHCVQKKTIPNIFDCNLKKDYQILIIFDKNISDTTGDQMTFQFSTAPIVCFCTTWGNKTNEILHFVLFRLLGFSEVVQKQTLGEVGTRTVIWWQVVSKMFAPKIIKICQSFFKSKSIMLEMLFDTFLFI